MWFWVLLFSSMTGPGGVACNVGCGAGSDYCCDGGGFHRRDTTPQHICYGCCNRPDCKASFDLDHDGDIDLWDYAEWQRSKEYPPWSLI